MSLEEMISNNSGTFGLLTFLSGLLLGNWFAIGRDRRREFNEIADEIALLLIEKREGASEKLIWRGPTDIQLESLKRRTNKKPVIQAVEIYLNAIADRENQETGELGDRSYKDPEKIITAIDNLLKYVQRK